MTTTATTATTTAKATARAARALAVLVLTAGIVLCCALFAAAAIAANVKMETSKGVIVLAIDEERAPATAANFLQYVRDGFFDGLIFHRVIPGFVIQGGGFLPDMTRRETRPPIMFEQTGLPNKKYSISMARTNDPHSATSQFFINLNDNANLDGTSGDPGYAVFGRVIEGMEVVDSIAAARTGALQIPATPTTPPEHYGDVPVADMIITKAEIVAAEEEAMMQESPPEKKEKQQ